MCALGSCWMSRLCVPFALLPAWELSPLQSPQSLERSAPPFSQARLPTLCLSAHTGCPQSPAAHVHISSMFPLCLLPRTPSTPSIKLLAWFSRLAQWFPVLVCLRIPLQDSICNLNLYTILNFTYN